MFKSDLAAKLMCDALGTTSPLFLGNKGAVMYFVDSGFNEVTTLFWDCLSLCETLFDILHLFAHLLDQHFQLDRHF